MDNCFKILRKWFNVLDFQLLKEFLKKFEKVLSVNGIDNFTKIISQSNKKKIKMTLYEETMHNLLILQHEICTSLNLGGIRKVVESACFMKINHLLYKSPKLLALKVSTLIQLGFSSLAEILVMNYVEMRKKSLGLLRNQIDKKKFQMIMEVTRVNLQECFKDFENKFKLKIANEFKENLKESIII